MEDSSIGSTRLDSITIQKAFEMSSNVGIAKLIDRYYNIRDENKDNKGARQFINTLRSF